MIHRLEIAMKVTDTRANALKNRFISDGFPISDLWCTDIYTIDKKYSQKQLKQIASVLVHPLTHRGDFEQGGVPAHFDWAIEIGYLPGVTDNVATTTKEMISDLLRVSFQPEEGVYTSKVIYLVGKLKESQVTKLASGLYNPLIERMQYTHTQLAKATPKVLLPKYTKTAKVDLDIDDRKLEQIGVSGIAGPLALDLASMKAIQAYFKNEKRSPTDVELESIAQTWSEHCKHTIFSSPIDGAPKGIFKTYIKAATEKIKKINGKKDICVSVFTDNSGAIVFDETNLVTHKVETHNSPSALDPFGGAVTGIVGVNRDALGFGLGAKPVLNMYGFCLANPNDTSVLYRDKDQKSALLSPRRIFDGVVAGVNVGGNCSGIPTPQGFLYFDSRYKGKPLVFVGTVGLIPRTIHGRKSYMKKAKSGDLIVVAGGRVGLDGIHGATFSSEALHSGSPAGAVQIGDPITQKKMSDAIIKEARDKGLYTSITDNGAGGLSCSVAEMAKESGGCMVDLSKVPLKYSGLSPWQIWISESQERMTFAVAPNKWKKLQALFKSRGVEATMIGKFTKSGKCVVSYGSLKVMDIAMKFLHDGIPVKHLTTEKFKETYPVPKKIVGKSFSEILLSILGRQNIGSFAFISGQYDHEVQGSSVIKPLVGRGRVNSDAQVIRPVFSSSRGIVVSSSLYPSYGDIDTYHMAACAIDTAIRNVVSAGGNPDHIALLDNFCWSSSNDPKRLYQLVKAAQACYDYAVAFKTPFISGKDSMFNDFRGFDGSSKKITISVPPTLLISTIGIIEDSAKAISSDAKMAGDYVYVLGKTNNELGGSEYYAFLGGIGQSVPQVDAKVNTILYRKLYTAIDQGLLASAQSVHRGGLAIALAKTAIGGQLGLTIDIQHLGGSDESLLFSESQGRIVVTVSPEQRATFEKHMKGSVCVRIGQITDTPLIRIDNGVRSIVDCKLSEADKAYKRPFVGY